MILQSSHATSGKDNGYPMQMVGSLEREKTAAPSGDIKPDRLLPFTLRIRGPAFGTIVSPDMSLRMSDAGDHFFPPNDISLSLHEQNQRVLPR